MADLRLARSGEHGLSRLGAGGGDVCLTGMNYMFIEGILVGILISLSVLLIYHLVT